MLDNNGWMRTQCWDWIEIECFAFVNSTLLSQMTHFVKSRSPLAICLQSVLQETQILSYLTHFRQSHLILTHNWNEFNWIWNISWSIYYYCHSFNSCGCSIWWNWCNSKNFSNFHCCF
jgi:hypothetical protein